ncbi:MAG: S9 family peptidase [Proteobacteria bacterium]|nr:S9 family peptidase [Pseudomonadota bacterium]
MLLCATSLLAAEKPDLSLLTVKRIFDSSDFNGEKFSGTWLEDGSGYTTFETSKTTTGGHDLVLHDPKTGAKEVLVPAAEFIPPGETAPLTIDGLAWSKDRSRLLLYTNSKRVWRTNSRGDYWVLDRSSQELFKLGGEAQSATLMFAKFSPDARSVAYVREQNLYVQDLHSRRITALTTNTSPEIINGTFDWVYEEEFGLRDGFRWSPDGRFIAFWQLNTEGVREVALVNNTDGLYPKTQLIKYPKTGEMNSSCRVGAIELATGQTRWMEVPGDPRNHYLFDLEWPEGSPEIFLQQLNRLQNTNRVMLADPLTGKVKPLLTDRDAAWVEEHQNLKWLDGGKRFLFWSERDGWEHLYVADRADGKLKLATTGAYDVTGLVHMDVRGGWLYFMASPDNPTQRYLYRTRLSGRQRQRVTPSDQPGTHSYLVSPDGRWAFHTRSTFNQPPVTELISLPDHKSVRLLTDDKKLVEQLKQLKQPVTEFFRVPVAKGVELDAWCIKPPDFDPARKYPLLIHVYGEPAGSTVRDAWGGKTHLWHRMFAQQGYLVMSFDNRGTATPRGRDWHKSIYGQVGILASQDQAAALKQVIATRPYVDAGRIGIWGWSGGGSMTLNALLRYPDLYHTGIAIASVPNMRFYDTIYQERYMGLPDQNVDGYRNGSPITFAGQLKGNLLLIHGTGDDNCHYQGPEALINEFIRLNKPFRMMAYPNRSHSISEGANTTLHLREMMTSFLHEKLPVK